MDLELEGKVAIVTGGSRGIGKAIGRVLAGKASRSHSSPAPRRRRSGGRRDAAGAGRAKGFACDTTDDAA